MESEIETFLAYLWHLFEDKLKVPEYSHYGKIKIIFLDFGKSRIRLSHINTTNNKKDLKTFFLKVNATNYQQTNLFFPNTLLKIRKHFPFILTAYTESMIDLLPEYFPPTLFPDQRSKLVT